jgi:hypothetical protein
MRCGWALRAILFPLAFATIVGSAHAAPTTDRLYLSKPSIKIRATTVSGRCISIKVSVDNFKLLDANISYPHVLKGNQGFIDYHLSGAKRTTMVRDESNELSHTWCQRDGVRRGTNIVQVYLVTTRDTLFPGTVPLIRIARVK